MTAPDPQDFEAIRARIKARNREDRIDRRLALFRPIGEGVDVVISRGFYTGLRGTVDEVLDGPDSPAYLQGRARLVVRVRAVDIALHRIARGTPKRDRARVFGGFWHDTAVDELGDRSEVLDYARHEIRRAPVR